jgi:anti-sigma factor RsiW
MKHPDPGDWIPYLYGECPKDARTRLDEHLAGCPACRNQIAEWGSTLERLDHWRLAPLRPPHVEPRPAATPATALLRWAAVVLISALVGGIAGRWSAPAASQPTVANPGTPALAPHSAGPDATTLATLERLRRDNDARYLALRRDLETLATSTDNALRQARRGLYQLAAQQSSEPLP